MARNLINKYVWIIDTIKRHHRITREELNSLWLDSSISDGEPLARRTFYNYRNGIADTFSIDIACDKSTYEYYIDQDASESNLQLQEWLLNSVSISGVLSDSHDVSERILLEDVPSSRGNLPIVIDAMRQQKRITFSYRNYSRANINPGVKVEPYFVKIFDQRWYVIGLNVADKRIKTYSLDRISDLVISDHTFTMPADFDPKEYFTDCFGITTDQNEPKNIVIKAELKQAKYLRGLPLHHSQREELHDAYSIFSYHMRFTYDLMQKLLSFGPSIEVLKPREVRVQMAQMLQAAVAQYSDVPPATSAGSK